MLRQSAARTRMARPVRSVHATSSDDVVATIRDEESVHLHRGCEHGRDGVHLARQCGELASIGLDDDRGDARPVGLDRAAHGEAGLKSDGQLTDPGAVGGHPRQTVEFVGADPAQRPVIVGVQRSAGLRDAVGAQRRRLVQRHVGADPRPDSHLDAEFLAQFAGQSGGVALPRRHLAARQLPQACQLRRPRTLGHQQQRTRDHCTGNDNLV